MAQLEDSLKRVHGFVQSLVQEGLYDPMNPNSVQEMTIQGENTSALVSIVSMCSCICKSRPQQTLFDLREV